MYLIKEEERNCDREKMWSQKVLRPVFGENLRFGVTWAQKSEFYQMYICVCVDVWMEVNNARNQNNEPIYMKFAIWA